MNTRENLKHVESALYSVASQAKEHRAMLLTESDLKCRVFMELSKFKEFNGPFQSFDTGITGSAIHTETKFFDENRLLRKAPDIIITDPSKLSIRSSLNGEPLPTKGFHFDGSAILIELKFLKRNSKISPSDLEKVEADLQKGIALNERGDLDFFFFVAVFDRFNHSENAIGNMVNKYAHITNLKCIYFPGGGDF